MIKININMNKNETIVIGCSAGPDSMALLHYMKNNYPNKIICAHINHNIRKESDEEEKYLENYCKQNNIIFESTKIESYNKSNLENQARIKRYNFYKKILTKYNSKYLFLAHHGDDLIETILMKIERGSNLEGYAGIKQISKNDNYQIIRPLLKYTKDDLIKYDEKNKIKYFIDKTNFDEKYTRNRYRHNVLPFLKNENINIHKKYLKYSNTLLEYNEYINYEVNETIKNIYTNNTLDIKNFKELHIFLQKNILYKILNDIYNNKSDIVKEKNVKDIIDLINNQKPNLTINLPKNIIIKKEYNKLIIKENENKNNDQYKIEIKNKIEKDNYIIEEIENTNDDSNKICRIDSSKIKLPLYVRNRKNGDKIETLGLNGRKKIKEIFIENKIPEKIRNTYPIVVDSEDKIIWIPNLKKSKFNSKKTEFYDIILRYCEKEENNEQ